MITDACKISGPGKCVKSLIEGNIKRIEMFSGQWYGRQAEPVPSGFKLYTDSPKGQVVSLGFGNTANKSYTTTEWTGKGRIVGLKYDANSGQADFMNFRICNRKEWWVKPKPKVKAGKSKCSNDSPTAKVMNWYADFIGIDCKNSAQTLVSGVMPLLAMSATIF